MRRTLFYIPDQLFGLPLFGLGWLFLVWLVVGIFMLVQAARHRRLATELQAFLPVWLLVALGILVLIPKIEEPIPSGYLTIPPLRSAAGLPIRGYGVMLLVAMLAGVGLAVHRARRAGWNPDTPVVLALYLFVGGIVGARLFYVIEYWPQIQGSTWRATLGNILNFVQGGLVVYGSMIGAFASFILFVWQRRLNGLALADLIAPGLLLGLALGRGGCLLNGCCFGSVSSLPWAVSFPPDSPPYQHQKGWGQLHGLEIAAGPGGVPIMGRSPTGMNLPLQGQRIVAIDNHPVQNLADARYRLEMAGPRVALSLGNDQQIIVGNDRLPARSRPVHPTQVYSSINAALLCLVALAAYPLRRRDGEIIALSLGLYAISRFCLEVIRDDEPGMWGSSLTISQWISIGLLAAVVIGWFWIRRRSPYAQCVPTASANRFPPQAVTRSG